MKLFALALLASLASVSAHAETLNCVFTEPFITISYSTTTRLLTVKNDMENKTRAIKNVEFAIEGSNEFSLRSGSKQLARLKLTNQGSDGMSDTVYPFEIESALGGNGGANGNVGGCSSSLLMSHYENP